MRAVSIMLYVQHGTDSLQGSSVKLGTMQMILAWTLRKDDTHTSRSVNSMCSIVALHAVGNITRLSVSLCTYVCIYIYIHIYIYIYT